MSIIRAPRPDSNFYLLNKDISEDKSLGWAARGLLIFLLGKPDHWAVSVQALVNEVENSSEANGRDRTYSLITQLIEAGYIVRRQGKGEAGKFSSYDYLVSEKPLPAQPYTDLPYTDQPYPVKPTLVSIEDNQVLNGARTESSCEVQARSPKQDTDDDFEKAWKLYPKREGANPKNKALSAWKARRKEGVTVETMIEGLARYAAFSSAKGNVGTEFIMQGSRFFGPGREFENEWKASPANQAASRHHGFDQRDYNEGLFEREDGTYGLG